MNATYAPTPEFLQLLQINGQLFTPVDCYRYLNHIFRMHTNPAYAAHMEASYSVELREFCELCDNGSLVTTMTQQYDLLGWLFTNRGILLGERELRLMQFRPIVSFAGAVYDPNDFNRPLPIWRVTGRVADQSYERAEFRIVLDRTGTATRLC